MPSDLIYREDAKDYARHAIAKGLNVLDYLDEVPTADFRPVVRGNWIGTKEAEEMGDITKAFTCSVCGCCDWDCTESESFKFCPNCGLTCGKKKERS